MNEEIEEIIKMNEKIEEIIKMILMKLVDDIKLENILSIVNKIIEKMKKEKISSPKRKFYDLFT
jgi:hypothetical protein